VNNMPGGSHEFMKAWDPHEDKIIIEMHAKEGPRWKQIVKKLPGRTVSSTRNRFQRIEKGRLLREKGTEGQDFKNRCLACGQHKRGHICQAKMNQPQAIAEEDEKDNRFGNIVQTGEGSGSGLVPLSRMGPTDSALSRMAPEPAVSFTDVSGGPVPFSNIVQIREGSGSGDALLSRMAPERMANGAVVQGERHGDESCASLAILADCIPRQPTTELLVLACSPTIAPLNVACEVEGLRQITPSLTDVLEQCTAEKLSSELARRPVRRIAFLGHGDATLDGETTFAFTTEEGELSLVCPQAIAGLLGANSIHKGGKLELVFLSSGEVSSLGRAVHNAGVPYVVGWNKAAENGAAAIFSTRFFEALVAFEGLDLNLQAAANGAFEQAVRAVRREEVKDIESDTYVPKYNLREVEMKDMQESRTYGIPAGVPVLISAEGTRDPSDVQ